MISDSIHRIYCCAFSARWGRIHQLDRRRLSRPLPIRPAQTCRPSPGSSVSRRKHASGWRESSVLPRHVRQIGERREPGGQSRADIRKWVAIEATAHYSLFLNGIINLTFLKRARAIFDSSDQTRQRLLSPCPGCLLPGRARQPVHRVGCL